MMNKMKILEHYKPTYTILVVETDGNTETYHRYGSDYYHLVIGDYAHEIFDKETMIELEEAYNKYINKND